jgi:hypothetical protein
LKATAAAGKMPDIEERQLRLLDFPASKQFILCVIGALREEIAGTKIGTPALVELNDDYLTADGQQAIDAWTKVLKSILPVVVQSLPGEEYQVVRSTEHLEAVAKTTKGIVAGAHVLHTSFEDLRALLRPAL